LRKPKTRRVSQETEDAKRGVRREEKKKKFSPQVGLPGRKRESLAILRFCEEEVLSCLPKREPLYMVKRTERQSGSGGGGRKSYPRGVLPA